MNSSKDVNRKPGCSIPLSSGCLHGFPLPSSFEKGIKMKRSNTQRPYQDRLMHPECFHALNYLIKSMSDIGPARRLSNVEKRSNLWDKKGLSLI
ncbi:unnamed protein product [Litomosoides sigmodontis]|uniref:Headcase N-terminal domain-containing protein n=1 Tax=Litomosoides sigmodontis TaxID=42156 RepID=A0A3P6TVF9_LITSI|nr:unnamed protein product [Litomosoides sigmodontis]VDK82960.1 unnamed protein product [Litomosoides sigmodontis]